MSKDSLTSNSAFSSRVPSVIAFSDHPGSIHLNLSHSEQDILENYFKQQNKSKSNNSINSTLDLPTPIQKVKVEPKKNRFDTLKSNIKKVSFKLKKN